MKKFNGCAIKENTIVLTKAFAKQAYIPGTAEFRHLAELHKAFPDFPIVMRTVKENKDKEKHEGLSIPRMELIIKDYFRDEIALAEFKEVQKFYKGTKGFYGKVKGWFLKKFPNYQDTIDFADVATAQKPDDKANENDSLRIAG